MLLDPNLMPATNVERRQDGRATGAVQAWGNNLAHIIAATGAYWFRELCFVRNSLARRLVFARPHRATLGRTVQEVCIILALTLGTEACTLGFLPPLSLSDNIDGGVTIKTATEAADAGLFKQEDPLSEMNKWAPIFQNGGTYDFDGDGLPDVSVTVNGRQKSMETYRLGTMLSHSMYIDNRLVEEEIDFNGDGKFDEVSTATFNTDSIVNITMSNRGNDGFYQTRDTNMRHLDTGITRIIRETSTHNIDGTTSFKATRDEETSTEMLRLVGSTDGRRVDPGNNTVCNLLDPWPRKTHVLWYTEAGAAAKKIGVMASQDDLDGIVVPDPVPPAVAPFPTASPNSPLCQLGPAGRVLQVVAQILNHDLNCLDGMRPVWAAHMRMNLSNYTLLFDCAERCADGISLTVADEATYIPDPRPTEPGMILPPFRTSGVLRISLNKTLFVNPDIQLLENTVLHEMIHTETPVEHSKKYGVNTLDGDLRETEDGLGVDEVYACGSFCASCHVEMKSRTEHKPFLNTHIVPDANDADVVRESLAEECSRCAMPTLRSQCGSKLILNTPVGKNLSTQWNSSYQALDCTKTDNNNLDITDQFSIPRPEMLPGSVCWSANLDSVGECGTGVYHTVASCDDRYLMEPSSAGEGYAEQCAPMSLCSFRHFDCPTACSAGISLADGVKYVLSQCAAHQNSAEDPGQWTCRTQDQSILKSYCLK
jgi:hypothetical protein